VDLQAVPTRIQLRRSKGWRMPANTVKVDRTTLFGNPFSAEQHGRTGAIRMFELWLDWNLPPGSFPDQTMAMLMTKRQMVLERLPTLRGKNLACWCPLPEPGERDTCHAAVLLERANSGCE
jgi:Domain of unknown function (DUF4326)